jgi:hypothetical protein
MRIIMCSSSTGVGTATHQASSKKKSFLIDDILQLEKKKERSLHSLDGSATNRQKVPPFCPHLPSPSAQNGYVPVVTQSFSSTHAAYGGFQLPSQITSLPSGSPSSTITFPTYLPYPQIQRFHPYCVMPQTEGDKCETDSSGRKRRKSRTVFSEYQLMGLEKKFQMQKYLSVPDRVELAAALNLTETQVKTWFESSFS